MQDDFEISKEFNLPQEETKKMKLNKNLIGFLGVGIIILLVLGIIQKMNLINNYLFGVFIY